VKLAHYDEPELFAFDSDNGNIPSTEELVDEDKARDFGSEASTGCSRSEQPDITDDPVQLYLHNIGKVGLLTAFDERELSKKVELAGRLRRIIRDYLQENGKPPSTTEIVLAIRIEIGRSASIIRLLRDQLGLPVTDSLVKSISEAKLRYSQRGDGSEYSAPVEYICRRNRTTSHKPIFGLQSAAGGSPRHNGPACVSG
jgi:hypothetical protein